MIAAWMAYTLLVTLLLYAAAIAVEHVALAARSQTRLVWFIAMLAAVALSGHALLRGDNAPPPPPPPPAPRVTGVPRSDRIDAPIPTAAGRGSEFRSAPVAASRSTFRNIERSVTRPIPRLDVTALDRWNRPLFTLWVVSSALVLCWLLVSILRLRRLANRLDPKTVAGRTLLVSNDVGPALLGVLRTRIVVPRWVLDLPADERDTIFAHEEQHDSARDPALVFLSMCIVVLEPWNIILWMLLARLRLALEADCDRRVLRGRDDARAYGRLLVVMYERTMRGPTAHVAFVEPKSNLERRIRRMTSRPRLFSAAVGVSAIASVVLTTAAWKTSAPTRTTRLVSPALAPAAPAIVTNAASGSNDIARAAHPADNRAAPLRHDARQVPKLVAAPVPAVQQTSIIHLTIEPENQAAYRLTVPQDSTMRPLIARGRAEIDWAIPPGGVTLLGLDQNHIDAVTGLPAAKTERLDAPGSGTPFSIMEITSLDSASQVHVEATQNGRVIASGEGTYLVLRRDSLGVEIAARSHVPRSSPKGLAKSARPAVSNDSDLVRVGYLQRKQTATGFFADSSDIDRRSPLFSDAVRPLPGLRVSPTANGHTNVIATTDGRCLTTFVDGAAFQSMAPGDIDGYVGASQVIALELYQPPSVPPQFVRRDDPACAVLVVWTQALRRRGR